MKPIEPNTGALTRRDFSKALAMVAVASAGPGFPAGPTSAQTARAERDERMRRANLGDIELEYEILGRGDPVILMHAGVLAEWFEPLMEEPALNGHYRLVRYHRVGYAGSTSLPGPVSLATQAAQLRSLMVSLRIAKAHIVGHSSSANIALQFALDAPEMTQSLALLEPALLGVPSGPQVVQSILAPALDRYRAGDRAGAVDTFLRGVAGPGYGTALDEVLPGAFEQAVADADTFFGQELPAVREWRFERAHAERITVPVLAVIGANSDDVRSPSGAGPRVFAERQALLLDWLPNVEPFVLPDATHLLHVQNPRGTAEALAAFFARHPLASGAG
jgi:pimeloyl-ACP methyl ester carboxylesterase